MPAKLTKECQVEKSNIIHKNFYSYEKFVYINSVIKSWITCPIHGDFEMSMSNHTHKKNPQGCKYCTSLVTKNYVIQQSNIKHNNFYNYSLLEDNITSTSIINIICPIHNTFKIKASKHYNDGQGCKQCSKLGRPKLNDEYYIEKLKYFKYPIITKLLNINSHTVLKAHCNEHGNFNIKIHHAIEDRGCPFCATENKINNFSFSKTNFIKICNKKNSKGVLYIIKCFNENEEFYKIGITSRSIKERYSSKFEMPYKYEIIQEIIDSPENIYNFEKYLKQCNKQFKYIPLIHFPGAASECFKIT